MVNDPQSERRIKISVKDVGVGELFALVTGDEPEFTNTFEPISNEERIELERRYPEQVLQRLPCSVSLCALKRPVDSLCR